MGEDIDLGSLPALRKASLLNAGDPGIDPLKALLGGEEAGGVAELGGCGFQSHLPGQGRAV